MRFFPWERQKNLNVNNVRRTNMGQRHRAATLTALTKLTVRKSDRHLATLWVCSCSRKLNLLMCRPHLKTTRTRLSMAVSLLHRKDESCSPGPQNEQAQYV